MLSEVNPTYWLDGKPKVGSASPFYEEMDDVKESVCNKVNEGLGGQPTKELWVTDTPDMKTSHLTQVGDYKVFYGVTFCVVENGTTKTRWTACAFSWEVKCGMDQIPLSTQRHEKLVMKSCSANLVLDSDLGLWVGLGHRALKDAGYDPPNPYLPDAGSYVSYAKDAWLEDDSSPSF
jgi:hypothetical protein